MKNCKVGSGVGRGGGGQSDPGWRVTRFEGRVTLGNEPTFFPYKQLGYFCLTYQGHVDTYGACANTKISQNKKANDLKSKSR